MVEEEKYNEQTMQIIRELRKRLTESQSKLLKKIIALIAWAIGAYTLFTLLLCDKVLGVIDDASFFSWLFISFLCGTGIYLILMVIYQYFLEESHQ